MMNVQNLIEMLEYRRPAFSTTEQEFVERFILSIPGARADAFGNVIVDTCDHPEMLFSCHTDTVDHEIGFRKVVYDAGTSIMFAQGNDILGADDGAGVFIMVNMIAANVPGRYVFHRAEERGALGAKWIIENTPKVLSGMRFALAFDRMGTDEVITNMITGITCSNEFAQTLCSELGDHFTPADGIYTDTAFYIRHIPNCTNISVGYYDQHTDYESLDVSYLLALTNHLINNVVWTRLTDCM